MRELSTKALARMRAAGVEVDSVALASAEEKVSIRMPSPAPAPATAVASDEPPESGEYRFTRNSFEAVLKDALTKETASSDAIVLALYDYYMKDRALRDLILKSHEEHTSTSDNEDVYHTIASCIEDVAAFARVSASNRVQQSLVIASSCGESSISDMAYKFAAAEALAAYNATPDHAVKVPVGADTLAAVASALQGEATAAGLGGMTNAAWVNWKKVAATKGITLEDGDRTLIDAAIAGVNSRKANSSAAGLSMDTVFARMQLPAFTNAKTFGQKVDVLQYGA